MEYKVEFTRRFVTGNLIGLTHRDSIRFPSFESAKDYIRFLEEHAYVPVKGIVGESNWVCVSYCCKWGTELESV
jgi:hypothetical protein